jgi:flagellar motor switch protein FliM
VELKSLEGSLRSARIPIQARFEDAHLTIRDLVSLKEGSVLNTNLATDAELFVYIAGQKRFAGVPGRVAKNLAARLVETLEVEPMDLIQPGRERD